MSTAEERTHPRYLQIPFAKNLTIYPDRSPTISLRNWGPDANQAMISEFVSAIRERRRPVVTGSDGYRALETVIAAYESAHTGQPVRLPLAN